MQMRAERTLPAARGEAAAPTGRVLVSRHEQQLRALHVQHAGVGDTNPGGPAPLITCHEDLGFVHAGRPLAAAGRGAQAAAPQKLDG